MTKAETECKEVRLCANAVWPGQKLSAKKYACVPMQYDQGRNWVQRSACVPMQYDQERNLVQRSLLVYLSVMCHYGVRYSVRLYGTVRKYGVQQYLYDFEPYIRSENGDTSYKHITGTYAL